MDYFHHLRFSKISLPKKCPPCVYSSPQCILIDVDTFFKFLFEIGQLQTSHTQSRTLIWGKCFKNIFIPSSYYKFVTHNLSASGWIEG